MILNRKNHPNRKWNYLYHFQASDEKNIFFTKCFLFLPESINWLSKEERELSKQNYLSHFQISVQEISFTKCFSFSPWSSNWFSIQEMELSEQEMELFLPLPGLSSKNFFHNIFFILTKEFKIDFQQEIQLPKLETQISIFTKCFSFLPRSSNWLLE